MNNNFVVSILILMLVVGVSATIMNTYKNNLDISYNSTSETILDDYDSVTTLNYEPVSVTSTTKLNQTWLDFDGDNDRVNSSSGYVIGSGDATACIWVYSLNDSGTYFNNLRFILNGNDFNDRYTLYSYGGSGNYAVSSTDSIDLETWSFICGRRNSTGYGYIHKNGVIIGENYTGDPSTGSTSDLHIGTSPTLTSDFNGSLDEPMVWNRFLDFNQIVQLKNMSKYGDNLGLNVPIIMYHAVGEENYGQAGNGAIIENNFSWQMSYLNSSGYNTITLKDFYQWTIDNYTMPKKPIILTFDDAWNSVILNATYYMDLYGYVGVIAVPSSYPDGAANRTSWDNLTTLLNKGWEVASHGVLHQNFTDEISPSNWIAEFNDSKNQIEANLSTMITSFIYPDNAHNDTIDSICGNYYDICTGNAGTVNSHSYKSSDLTGGIDRVNIVRTTDNDTFITRVDLWADLDLYYKFDENSGTTAYDVSGNGNNGTISGATWNNDGVNLQLTEDVDYDISGSLFTILNPELAYSQINTSYSFLDLTTQGIDYQLANDTENGLAEFGTWFTIIVIIVVIGILFFMIFQFTRTNSGGSY